MRAQGLLLTLLALGLGCKSSADGQIDRGSARPAQTQAVPAATNVVTDAFSLSAPTGYDAQPAHVLADMSKRSGQEVVVALMAERPRPDYFRPSIIIVTVAANDLTIDAACKGVAEPLAKAIGATVKQLPEAAYPFGKTCRFSMRDAQQQALLTVAYVGQKYWMVTCNFDPRDETAPAACESVLQSFAIRSSK